MRVLVTGSFGQDGIILSELLASRGDEVVGSFLLSVDDPSAHPFLNESTLVALDVTNADQVDKLFSTQEFDAVIHLAGQTSVAHSWQNPALTMSVNIVGTSNILTSIKEHQPSTHFVNAVSVEVFDSTAESINELTPMRALNPYGVSKLAAAQLTTAMASDGLITSNVFLSNHESKYRPEKFVMGKIARGVAAIADAKQDRLTLGDISVTRDWSSAYEICNGIAKVVDQQFQGDVILASGTNCQLSDIVQIAFESVGISQWQDFVDFDRNLIRPNDGRTATIDISKAKKALDWHPVTPTSTWVAEMVKAFRS